MSGGMLEPDFLDLMIWAVLVGSREMARELWGQTTDPLRSALVASLVCRQVAVRIFNKVGPPHPPHPLYRPHQSHPFERRARYARSTR